MVLQRFAWGEGRWRKGRGYSDSQEGDTLPPVLLIFVRPSHSVHEWPVCVYCGSQGS